MALLGLPDSTSVSVSFDFFIKYTARASVVCMITSIVVVVSSARRWWYIQERRIKFIIFFNIYC